MQLCFVADGLRSCWLVHALFDSAVDAEDEEVEDMQRFDDDAENDSGRPNRR